MTDVADLPSQLVDVEVMGVRKMGQTAAVTRDDRFYFGANVKAMTATLVAMLVEQGKLSWGSRPRDLFPELARSFDRTLADVTLEQILAHRAGIVPLTDLNELAQAPSFEGDGAQQRLAFVAWALSRTPSPPAGQYSYSNAGYVVAAAMAERASAESWETLIKTRLFQPLGIEAGFGWPAQDAPNQPWGHIFSSGAFVPHDPQEPTERLPAFLWPAGALSTSVEQYSRFLRLHLRGLRGANDLVSAETFKKLHAPVGSALENGTSYALGWGIVAIGGVTTSAHDGSAGTFYVSAALQPDRDLAVAVVTNAGGEQAGAGCGSAVLQLLERYRNP